MTYTPYQVKQAVDLYLNGHGLSHTARLTGVAHTTVKRWVLSQGFKIRPASVYSPVSRANGRSPGDNLKSGKQHSTRTLTHTAGTRPKRPNSGPRNGRWKGDQVGYVAAHERVKRARGKPSYCEECGTTDPAKRYEWANQTGNYADPDDYRRMCKPCHASFDAERRRAAR